MDIDCFVKSIKKAYFLDLENLKDLFNFSNLNKKMNDLVTKTKNWLVNSKLNCLKEIA